MTLPAGFKLDEEPAGLPPGFKLDEPKPANPLLVEGLKLFRGLVTGGPLGMAAEGMKSGAERLDRAAYDVGGWLTDKTGSPEAGLAANVATQAIPTLISGPAAAKAAAPVFEAAGKRFIQSAMKPNSNALASGDAAKAIDTLLNEGANVTRGGIAKLRGLVDKLHGEVAGKVQEAAKSGATVNRGYVDSEIYNTVQHFRNQLNPGADEAAILKSWAETKAKIGNATIGVDEAQKLKQGTYSILAEKYAKQGASAVDNEAATQAQMAGARGLRKGIEDAVPGVAQLNAREAAIINAIELAEKRAGVADNRDIAGIAWLASNPKAFAAATADRSELFKSILARMLYSGRERIPATAAQAGTIAGVSANNESK